MTVTRVHGHLAFLRSSQYKLDHRGGDEGLGSGRMEALITVLVGLSGVVLPVLWSIRSAEHFGLW